MFCSTIDAVTLKVKATEEKMYLTFVTILTSYEIDLTIQIYLHAT